MKDEASYTCDSCGEEIVVPIDLSAGTSQQYVEDCPVCCRPNVIHVEIDDAGDVRVRAEGNRTPPPPNKDSDRQLGRGNYAVFRKSRLEAGPDQNRGNVPNLECAVCLLPVCLLPFVFGRLPRGGCHRGTQAAVV